MVELKGAGVVNLGHTGRRITESAVSYIAHNVVTETDHGTP